MPGSNLSGQAAIDAAGFFGKLPERGDFLSRRLPSEFIGAWDPWLQAGLNAGHRLLGDRWLDVYLVGPIWHFVLTDGLAGPSPWAGILMPSVDRVGRYFPLTIAASVPAIGNPFYLLRSAANWLDRLQMLALEALEGALTVEDLNAALIELGRIPISGRQYRQETPRWARHTPAWRLGLSDPRQIAEVIPDLLHETLTARHPVYSLWWSGGTEHIAPSLLVHEGLPQHTAFTALYTGDWSAGGWIDLGSRVENGRRDPKLL